MLNANCGMNMSTPSQIGLMAFPDCYQTILGARLMDLNCITSGVPQSGGHTPWTCCFLLLNSMWTEHIRAALESEEERRAALENVHDLRSIASEVDYPINTNDIKG